MNYIITNINAANKLQDYPNFKYKKIIKINSENKLKLQKETLYQLKNTLKERKCL